MQTSSGILLVIIKLCKLSIGLTVSGGLVLYFYCIYKHLDIEGNTENIQNK